MIIIIDAIPPWEYQYTIDNYDWSYFELYYWLIKFIIDKCQN